jgi:virginiamycin B lyase
MRVRKTPATVIATAVALLLAICVSSATAAPAVDGHFPVSGFDSNSKIAAGPDGNMWMAINGAGKDVARISPGGKVDEFELAGVSVPSGIAAGPEGKLWITQGGGVGSFSPANPEPTIETTSIADVKANASIVAGPDGQMWVATEGNVVHFLPSKPGESKSIPIAGLSPKDIDVAGAQLVIADANNKRILTLTTAGVSKEISLGETPTSQGVAGSPSGQIGFSKSEAPEGLGLVTPPGAPAAVEMLGDPFGVARGSDGAFWFAMSAADNLERLTPDGKATPLGGFPPKFFPRQIAAGPNNTLWVTMEIPGENVFEVARVSGLEPPVVPEERKAAPQTKIGKGPKGKVKIRARFAKVKFTFSSTTAGATFECALVRLKGKRKNGPKPKFKSCKSPKKLKLGPGRYRFSVRAVSGGLVDASPAMRGFRVVHVG